ncbi:hypothetical protein IP91_05035 [Pseudoduganella lurida]|uniref:Alpha/beta hydrolase n=1 Tax=Pseudoduganella lurida TaxID=1036180 RepID=A0A562QV44_9BURK|nr:alpha/beta hydrolase [Pseudoduganella lurida]TWI60627.1 hypothetical protein IP91_05035 [Pseudoduganella lurida]
MATYRGPESTRQLPTPTVDVDGTVRGKTTLSPTACKVRGRLEIPPIHVVPIILVPGIMGSNLRANADKKKLRNQELRDGEAAWRPPNGLVEGLGEADKWETRTPEIRQKILDGNTLEVDPNGSIEISSDAATFGLTLGEAKSCGWGQIHSSSYGPLLRALRKYFSNFFECSSKEKILITEHWNRLNNFPRRYWDGEGVGALKSFTVDELLKLAKFRYPVYASGYNWLQSNETSAKILQHRILEIINYWNAVGQKCSGIVLVSHSMGGLVARACAKGMPEKIIGVVHACMPDLGAPVCYRRISCGTENSSPLNNEVENVGAEKFAVIAGVSALETTPVMAFSAGALELLPNHRYPIPWLTISNQENTDSSRKNLLTGNLYDLYLERDAWYRLFFKDIADPANLHKGKVQQDYEATVNQARKFHQVILDDYYHHNTYAFYGADGYKTSYGRIHWTYSSKENILPDAFMRAKSVGEKFSSNRQVQLPSGQIVKLELSRQDSGGDGTVPSVSGAGPKPYVKAIFGVRGFGHQDVFASERMQSLTIQLVARVILEKT